MTHPALVILLHGVGSNGGDLAPLAGRLRPALPHADFVAPDAPNPFDGAPGPGRQWFGIAGITPANRADRVVAARAGFDRTLRSIVEAHGLADRLDRVALVGFSQGAIMSLDAVASGRWNVAAVVAFSGRLATPPPLSPSQATKVLVAHGTADQVIPSSESEHAAAVLLGLGMSVASLIQPGIGHTISPEGAALAARFLAEALPG